MFPEGHEPSSVTKPDTACVPSCLRPATDDNANADANIETNNGKETPDVDKKPLEPRLPVRTAPPTTTALKAVLLRSRASLNDEEKKHGEKGAPESNEVSRAKDKVDTLKIKLEDVKWEYERAKAEFEAHEQERIAFRTRHRELDEAERELDQLCHSQETLEVV
ncbi:hypothetical protein N7465_000847 [Penicillium sp. CMV-2018d]|nr:hypothetical protein N7465_000847 [Penicillium sp. CMV-2018d]